MKIIKRKIESAIILINKYINTKKIHVFNILNENIKIGKKCYFENNVLLKATDNGKITIGNKVKISQGVQIIARGGTIKIEENVQIGVGVIIVALEEISIGAGTLIAEYVVIRDQDHIVNDKNLISSGFKVNKIKIKENVWIGSKSTILRKSEIEEGAVIGAHTLVRGKINANTLAVGIPAKMIKNLK